MGGCHVEADPLQQPNIKPFEQDTVFFLQHLLSFQLVLGIKEHGIFHLLLFVSCFILYNKTFISQVFPCRTVIVVFADPCFGKKLSISEVRWHTRERLLGFLSLIYPVPKCAELVLYFKKKKSPHTPVRRTRM